jgi:replication factor A2
MFSSSLAFGGYSASQADVAMPDSTQAFGGRAAEPAQTLLPVTIKMVDTATTASGADESDLRIDGKSLNTILIVGCVQELSKQQTAIEFSVNDSSGKMRARYFFTPDMAQTLEKVENGVYVTIVGIVKMKPTAHVSVLTMRPIQSPDEISYHEIHVAYASLKSKKKPTMSGESAFSKVVSSPPRTEAPVETVVTPLRRNESNSATPPKHEGPLKERITKFLAEPPQQQDPSGVSMSKLCASFSDSKAEDVKASMNELLDEGMVYTTIDDDHFASV